MKKSIISVILVLAVALSLCTTVFAADWESEIDTVGAAIVNGKYYDTLQEAVNNAGDSVVKLLKNSAEEVTANGTLYLDLNGFTASGVTAGKICAYDASATTEAAGKGKLITTSTVEILTNTESTRYAALEEAEDTYTIHAFKLSLTDVSLRTEQAGIYYAAELVCDEALKNAVASHGVVLSLKDMPDANFEKENTNECTVIAGAPEGEFNSGYVFNIFKSDYKASVNAKRGEYKIYANAYLRLADGTLVMADTENGGTTWSEGYTGVTWGLKNVMEALNTNIDDPIYTNKLSEIIGFYKTWQDAMSAWNLSNIASKVG